MICKNLIQFIQRATKNKKVFDIGSLGNIENKIGLAHTEYIKNAKEVYSIDINKKYVTTALKNGIKNIYHVDISNKKYINNLINKLGKFEIVMMIEVIEHLTNPGLALENVKNLLTDDGMFIITTPNVFAIKWYNQMIKKDHVYSLNKEHMMWFDKYTLMQLLEKHNLYINRFQYTIEPTEHERACIVDGNLKEWMYKRMVVSASKLTRYERDVQKNLKRKEQNESK